MDTLIDLRLTSAGGAVNPGAAGCGQVIWLEPRMSAQGFTARDRSELDRWSTADRRVVIWESDPAPFAMLYDGAFPWASWAVSRQNGALLAWDCISFDDIGRFDSMVEALAAIGGPGQHGFDPPSNVISLPLGDLRRRAEAQGARAG